MVVSRSSSAGSTQARWPSERSSNISVSVRPRRPSHPRRRGRCSVSPSTGTAGACRPSGSEPATRLLRVVSSIAPAACGAAACGAAARSSSGLAEGSALRLLSGSPGTSGSVPSSSIPSRPRRRRCRSMRRTARSSTAPPPRGGREAVRRHHGRLGALRPRLVARGRRGRSATGRRLVRCGSSRPPRARCAGCSPRRPGGPTGPGPPGRRAGRRPALGRTGPGGRARLGC